MNGTINLKKLSTKMLDAISTLNTDVSNLTTSIPSQIKTNNRQTLATVEQNAEASSRAYAAGQYLAVNGKLYKALNDIAQGDTLQENVNIQWVLLGDEVNKLRGDLKTGAWKDVANNLTTNNAGSSVLDAYQGKLLNDSIVALGTRVSKIENRQVLYAFGNSANRPAYHTWITGASVTLPANSGRWLLLGQIYYNHYGGEAQSLSNIFVDPNPETAVRNAARTTTRDGGGVVTWGYALNFGKARTTGVDTYIYKNINNEISTNWNVGSVFAAINLG